MNDRLAAERLKHNPKVAEARRLIQEAIREEQKTITTIRPPDPARQEGYAKLLEAFAKYRGNKLYYPYISSGFGNGPFVELLDGSVKYDFITGVGVHYFGHNHPSLADASFDAVLSNTIMQGNLQQNEDSIVFTKLLLEQSKLDHCFLTSSGAMANENALKIAFQKRFPANRILAFERCFVGRTLAVSQVTDKPGFREGLPINYFVDYVPFYDPARPKESTEAAVTALKKHLNRYPNQHAVMIFELIQGEGGFYTATTEFFKTLMDLLKKHNVLIFDDEVQAFGRTGSLFAFDYYGLNDYVDIVSVGKLSQTCATLFRKELNPKPGLLSQTFTSSTAAIRAGITIIKELLEGNYYGTHGKIEQLHHHFTGQLESLSKRYPDLIQGPFGVGAMVGFTPFGGDKDKATQFTQKLFENGVMSFIAGSDPTRVRFLMPVGCVSFEDIDTVCRIIEETLLHFRSKT